MYRNIARVLYFFNKEKGINYARTTLKHHQLHCSIPKCSAEIQLHEFLDSVGAEATNGH